MRKLILFLAAVTVASPVWAEVYHFRPLHIRGRGHHRSERGAFPEARRLILDRNLLTPAQLRCALILRGNKAAGEVTQVRVLRRPPSPACPVTEADASPFLFDLYIDNTSGSYQWTPEGRPDRLEELPYLGDARHARLTGED